jgi:hypothetical protein
MGKYENGRYARERSDGELQWLEDGIGLLFTVAISSIVLLISGVIALITGIFSFIAGQDYD